MAEPARSRATYQDLIRVSSVLVAELINGQLVTSPRPSPPHARAASSLGGELHGPFDRGRGGPGGWIILDEPELHLDGDVLVPDIAGWHRERMPTLPQTSAFELAPDWVCEVLSPLTAALDRTSKVPVYAREEVGHISARRSSGTNARGLASRWRRVSHHRGVEWRCGSSLRALRIFGDRAEGALVGIALH